jgi:hypothetical protein
MAVVVALFGVLIAAIGAVGIAAPQRLLVGVGRLQSPRGLYAIAAIRIVMGTSLLVAAPDSRAPGFLFIVGALTLVSGIVTPLLGVERFEVIVSWWSRRSNLFVRAWCVVVLALGLGILMAGYR